MVAPAQVATVTRTVLIATRRSTRRHLIAEKANVFSSLGRVRLGNNPLCGRMSRRWRATSTTDPRPLCLDCRKRAALQVVSLATPYMHATPAEVHAALLAVTDPTDLAHLVFAICSRDELVHHVVIDPVYGGRRRLTAYVPAARSRCATSRRNRT